MGPQTITNGFNGIDHQCSYLDRHCSNCTATIYGKHNNSCCCIEKRLEYKDAFQLGKVCVHIVMTTLKELCSRHLYRVGNIHK